MFLDCIGINKNVLFFLLVFFCSERLVRQNGFLSLSRNSNQEMFITVAVQHYFSEDFQGLLCL